MKLGDGRFCAARRGVLTTVTSAIVAAVIAQVTVSEAATPSWPRFRGQDGVGRAAAEQTLPTTWSPEENIVWKTAMPGYGTSSPIVVGDKIFITAYSGYGLDIENPGEKGNLELHALCLNRGTGEIEWQKTIDGETPETDYRGFIALHGYASSTPVSDGEHVYFFFGHNGVFAYTVDGEPVWQADVGAGLGSHSWGSATSPLLHGDVLIVNASVESERIVGLSKKTGEQIWEVGGIVDSWSTPLVAETADGTPELIVSLKFKILGLDPATGKQLWTCRGVEDYVCPGVIAHGDVAYITAGRKPHTLAVKTGGRGDVSETHILWENRETPKVGTPIYVDGLLFWIDQRAVAACIDAKTGEVVWQERLDVEGRGDKCYSSLVYGDGMLYGVTRQDGTVVFAPADEFKLVAHNRLDESVSNATPAIDDNQLLLRSDKFLYCIGE